MEDKKRSSVTARYREGSRIGRRRATHASRASAVRAAERVKEKEEWEGRMPMVRGNKTRWRARTRASNLKRASELTCRRKTGKQEGGKKSPRCALPGNRPKELEKVRRSRKKERKKKEKKRPRPSF